MYERFAELLRRSGKKVADVARATGIRPTTFADWKAGRYTPKGDKLAKIADYFGVTSDYFYSDESSDHLPAYYLNKEAAMAAQKIFDDPDLRALFDIARNSSADDLRLTAEFLKRLKRTNPDG